jgi:hypothetical protein
MKLEGPDLRREIDETLAEIERVENEMLEVLAEVIGPVHARRLAEYRKAQERAPRLEKLRREGLPGPSSERPSSR